MTYISMKHFNSSLSASLLFVGLSIYSAFYINSNKSINPSSKPIISSNYVLNKGPDVFNIVESEFSSFFNKASSSLDNLVTFIDSNLDDLSDSIIFNYDNSNFGKYVNYLNDKSLRAIETFNTDNTSFVGRQIKADIDFFPYLFKLDNYAKSAGVKLHVNSSFRRLKDVIKSKAFEPAEYSNHHVGRAIDLNVKYKGFIYSSKMLSENFNNLPKPVKSFYNLISKDMVDDFKMSGAYQNSLVWGGFFGDFVHFDDNYSKKDRSDFNAIFRLYQFKTTPLMVFNSNF